MELNQQIFRAPSIPKIGKTTISSSVIRGAIKPQIKLNKSVFSFIKPSQNSVDVDKISGSLGGSADKQLAETNRILVEIQKQLALDFGYRIAEEKKALAAEKKRIAAQKVADKESKLEQGGKGILGKTFDKVVAPFKSIFQKLIDFFSIILTGIILNTAFKWLSDKNNQKKLAEFFGFLKEYWQELLIVFGIAKLAKLVAKIFSIASKIKKLLSFWPKKPGGGKDPCKCPKPGAPDFCKGILDCFDKVKSGSKIAENLATAIIGTTVFSNYMGRFGKQSQQPAPVLDTTKGSNIDQIYEEWNRRYQPATQTPQSQNGGLPPRLKQYIDNLQNQPSAEEKLFKQLGLPTWLTPVAEALITSALMSRGRGIPRFGTRSPRSTLDLGSTTSYQPPRIDYGPKINIENLEVPTTLRAPNIRVTGRGGRKTTVGGASANQSIQSILNNPRNTNEFLKYLKKSPSFRRSGSDPSALKTIDDFAAMQGLTTEQLIKSQLPNYQRYLNSQRVGRSKGGTIDGFSGGGTVGGLLAATGPIGSLLSAGKDVIPALLAKGEEVIRTSSAMLFRPLLKDINDHAGRLWQAFSNATTKQSVNNMIQSDLNRKFNDLITKFKDLIDGEIKETQRKKRKGKPGGGGDRGGWMGNSSMVNPFRNPLKWWNLGRNVRIPNERTAGLRTLIKDDLQQVGKFKTPTGYKGFNPMWSFTKGLGTGPTPIQRQLIERILPKFAARIMSAPVIGDMLDPAPAGAGSTLQEAIKRGDYKVPVSTPSITPVTKKPKVTVINLPPKTVNLGPKPGSVKTPSSGSATDIPSISPFDASNPYISSNRLAYGMIM